MKKKYPKIYYDRKSEVITIEFQNARSVDSDILGNIATIDYDEKGNIVRINLHKFNAGAFRSGERP